jgi:tetratricopeptide (TPR) repeat protein
VLSLPEKNESRVIFKALGLAGGPSAPPVGAEAFVAISELRKRLDPESLSVPGIECSVADLDVLEMEMAERLSDTNHAVRARKNAISSYERLLRQRKSPDSRGYNLELAALLTQDGQYPRALAIYEKFLAKYPSEFTFHFGAAKAYLESNDLKNARIQAEEAVRFAYGDNLIRSMDRLLKVMHRAGETGFAVRRGEEFLKGLHFDPNLKVRTGRYISALHQTLDQMRKETKP